MTPLSLAELVRRQECRAEAAAKLAELALTGEGASSIPGPGTLSSRSFWQTLALEAELARAILYGANCEDAIELVGRLLTHLDLRKAMASDSIERLAVDVATCELRLDLESWRSTIGERTRQPPQAP
jgi:hypothetical protein